MIPSHRTTPYTPILDRLDPEVWGLLEPYLAYAVEDAERAARDSVRDWDQGFREELRARLYQSSLLDPVSRTIWTLLSHPDMPPSFVEALAKAMTLQLEQERHKAWTKDTWLVGNLTVWDPLSQKKRPLGHIWWTCGNYYPSTISWSAKRTCQILYLRAYAMLDLAKREGTRYVSGNIGWRERKLLDAFISNLYHVGWETRVHSWDPPPAPLGPSGGAVSSQVA